MILELAGTIAETLQHLRMDTLDPRDETTFVCMGEWIEPHCWVWDLRGSFVDSGYTFHLRHVGSQDGIAELTSAIRRNRLTTRYTEAWLQLIPRLESWLEIGRGDYWVSRAADPPFSERSFALCRTSEQMARAIDRNNWSIGTAFVLAGADLCLMQRENGPGEFLVIRGTTAFESWSTGKPYIHGDRLVRYLNAVAEAPVDAGGVPLWYERVAADEVDTGQPVVVADSVAALTHFLR